MQVLDHEPYHWYLLEEDGALFLDAHCSHSFIDYSVLIALNNAETKRYAKDGRAYLGHLATDIHYGAPILVVSTSPYKGRDLTRTAMGERSHAAIMAWREKHDEATLSPTPGDG
jgi:hypothetical protein